MEDQENKKRRPETRFNLMFEKSQIEPLSRSQVEARLQYIKNKVEDLRFNLLLGLITRNYATPWNINQIKNQMDIDFDFDDFIEEAKKSPYENQSWQLAPCVIDIFFDNHENIEDECRVNKELSDKLLQEFRDNLFPPIDKEKARRKIREFQEQHIKNRKTKKESKPVSKNTLLDISDNIEQEEIEDDI